ncbi:delta(14)-sterol reductase TM7SF2-like isoform X1 [Lethenteron reissneri]|uniref:delta(14)-sterol reductase TM7SF2-like isoform X1 n=1 Tax=Lethenteron reissneri TaxID=7753 RepID=UPI002AB7B595|nr:delta(14)-sterol reductase TM7SF2-like isoform X1 [Lethenteron reissneri]
MRTESFAKLLRLSRPKYGTETRGGGGREKMRGEAKRREGRAEARRGEDEERRGEDEERRGTRAEARGSDGKQVGAVARSPGRQRRVTTARSPGRSKARRSAVSPGSPTRSSSRHKSLRSSGSPPSSHAIPPGRSKAFQSSVSPDSSAHSSGSPKSSLAPGSPGRSARLRGRPRISRSPTKPAASPPEPPGPASSVSLESSPDRTEPQPSSQDAPAPQAERHEQMRTPDIVKNYSFQRRWAAGARRGPKGTQWDSLCLPLLSPHKRAVPCRPKRTPLSSRGLAGAVILLLVWPAGLLCLAQVAGSPSCSLLGSLSQSPGAPAWTPARLWDPRCLVALLAWMALQVLLFVLPLGGEVVKGALQHSGEVLAYRTNGMLALLLTLAAMGAGWWAFDLDPTSAPTLLTPLATAAAGAALLLGVALYIASLGKDTADLAPLGNTGNMAYDFVLGRELNPRMGALNVKHFCELRLGLLGWVVLVLGLVAAQARDAGTPCSALALVATFQIVYIAAALWNEGKLVAALDTSPLGAGFLLLFIDLAWTPLVCSLPAAYLVQQPLQLPLYHSASLALLYGLGLYIYCRASAERRAFQHKPSLTRSFRKESIPTATGKRLLVSGWWGVLRHPDTLGQLLMTVAWTLPCGVHAALPWVQAVYVCGALLVRGVHTEQACVRRYGAAWAEYCHRVPYRLLPGLY